MHIPKEELHLFFQNWHNQWIEPELKRRFGAAGIPSDFKIRQCLIKLPKDSKAIVEFNNEFGWDVENPTLANGKQLEEFFTTGKPVHLHELLDIGTLQPPTVEGERIAFMYLYWNGLSYNIYSDFLPLQPDYDSNDEKFRFDGRAIANHLKTILFELAVGGAKLAKDKLHQIGLWIPTSLLHYPLAKIVERIGNGEFEQARQVLIEHCGKPFITNLASTWRPITVFKERMPFFEDALGLHTQNRYHGTISILVGQIEGLLTDWMLHVGHYKTDDRRSLKDKLKDFRTCLNQIPDLLWTYRESRDSMLDFLDGEPWLQTFENWNAQINTSFPSRNVVQHGKYERDVFTEENSIKMFLMLDTICQFMMFYEVRVLGKDLGQNSKADPT